MKTFDKFAIAMALLLVLAGFAPQAQGQTALSSTTLGAAVTDHSCSDTTFTLASTSTMAGLGTQNQPQTVLYVDYEYDYVKSVTDSTHVVVQRCKGNGSGAVPFAHQSGTTVLFANVNGNNPAVTGFKLEQPTAELTGSCTVSNLIWTPRIYVYSGDVWDCKRTGAAGTNGQWIKVGTGTMGAFGKTISAFCTGTTGSGETEYLNGAACSGATTATFRYVVSTNGTLANLTVAGSANVVSMGSDAVTVYVNGSSTALTCTIASATKICSDTTHSVPVFVGDYVQVQVVSTTSDTLANVAATMGLY